MISKQQIAFNNIPRFFTALSYCKKGPNWNCNFQFGFIVSKIVSFIVCAMQQVQQYLSSNVSTFVNLIRFAEMPAKDVIGGIVRQCISTEGKWWQFQKILQQVYTHTEADHKICFQQAFKYFHGIVYAQVLTYQRKSRTVFIRLMPSQPLCAGFRCHNISIHCENKCLLANIFCQPILRGMQCR